ncbi:MAG: ribosome-associated translation inhibitor RaiA [Sulfurimonadaceae bacterium]|jgi:putative sigma-54 modulation protein|nr:ribosome-associated translation inhibitor RaiA [Sulfurimonadaceae bacterium]
MTVQIRAKDMTLQDATKAHIENAVAAFNKYNMQITAINVNIEALKKGVSVEFDIHVAHAQPVVITQTDDVLEAAIDLAIDRAATALRRLHEKMVEKQAPSIKDLDPIDA